MTGPVSEDDSSLHDLDASPTFFGTPQVMRIRARRRTVIYPRQVAHKWVGVEQESRYIRYALRISWTNLDSIGKMDVVGMCDALRYGNFTSDSSSILQNV